MLKERNKIIASVFCIVFTFAVSIYSLEDIVCYKNNSINQEEIRVENKTKTNLKEGIAVKSDGKEVAILQKEEEIKKLIDRVKAQYIKNSSPKEIEDIRLKSKITYYKTKVSADELKGIEYYASSIVNGHDGNMSIKFNIKEKDSKNKPPILSRGTVSSGFGERWGRMHNGIDIAAPLGTPIHCVSSGKVIYSGWEDGYGNVIKIDNGNNMVTIYGHCSKLIAKKGSSVKKGEKIGEVGSTGRSTGPHVHFEVRKNGVPQNPEPYLK
ncbi:M23 family metallopeptidase [Clostridium lundense]|uniref:M23 family metallopeptidase n=1 Tax=Clostridium lundense TaxID=319475 RepID=UPI000685F9B3|nr:M23 family metallopeptidase [Clostridium lundense]